MRGPRGRGAARLLRAVVADVSPLRESRGFRWLYGGQLGAQLSRQLLVVAVPYQVYVLTESSFMVGAIGLAQVVPLVLCSIVGGAVADVVDRRRLLVAMQLLMAAASVGFALGSGPQAPLWPIFALIALDAGAYGIESPTRIATIPSLVRRDQLASAFALEQVLTKTAYVVGPALAGVLIAQLGVAAAYWLSALSCVLTALALIPLGPRRPAGATRRVSIAHVVEGWRYVRGHRLLRQVMLIDLNAMVFGMPRALFPAMGLVLLGGDAATVGLLHAAPGAGALAGALTTGWVVRVKRQGRAVVVAVAIFGAAIAAAGLTRSLPWVLALLFVAGVADVVSTVFRNTILQLAVPDALRGRVTALKVALSGGGPQLGDAESGSVAALAGPTFSIVSGGVVTVAVTALIAWRGRVLWGQRAAASPDEPLPA